MSGSGHAKLSPRMLNSMAASRSGARKLRGRPQSHFATSLDVSVLSAIESVDRPSVSSQTRSKSSVTDEVDFASMLRRNNTPAVREE